MSQEMHVCPECGFGYLGVETCPRCHSRGNSDGTEIHIPWVRTRSGWAQKRIDDSTWVLTDKGPEPTDTVLPAVETRTCQAGKHSFVGTRNALCPLCNPGNSRQARLTESQNKSGTHWMWVGYGVLLLIIVVGFAALLINDTDQRQGEFSNLLSAMELAEVQDPWLEVFEGEACRFPEIADLEAGLSRAEARAVSTWAVDQEAHSRNLLSHVEESIRRLEAVPIRSLPTHSGNEETKSSAARHYTAWQARLLADIDSFQLVAASDTPEDVMGHLYALANVRVPQSDEISTSWHDAEARFRQHQPSGDFRPRIDAVFDSNAIQVDC